METIKKVAEIFVLPVLFVKSISFKTVYEGNAKVRYVSP